MACQVPRIAVGKCHEMACGGRGVTDVEDTCGCHRTDDWRAEAVAKNQELPLIDCVCPGWALLYWDLLLVTACCWPGLP